MYLPAKTKLKLNGNGLVSVGWLVDFHSISMDTFSTPVVASATGKVYKVPSRLGRGVPEVKDAYTKKCSCEREKTIVFCRACGYYCNGRIRLKCAVHPRVTFLLDISECPRCHSAAFLDEYCG